MKRLSTREDVVSLLESIDVFLLDCDGVLWRGGCPIQGASKTVQLIRKHGKRVVFITNNSVMSRMECSDHIRHLLSIDISPVLYVGSLKIKPFRMTLFAQLSFLQNNFSIPLHLIRKLMSHM
jgi:hypothetical protein